MNSFMETLKQLGPARLAIMGSVVLGLLLFFIFVSMRVSTPDMKLLYDDLSSVDSGAIVAKLEENEILYKVSEDGARVSVPEDSVGRARMLLAQAGLPNGGSMGYEIFDKQSGFGTTNFVQNINQVRALEGELARTISSLDQIRSARVHLVLPQRELFSRESRTATGSVFLSLRPGAQLSQEQILAIQSLVSSAVPDMKPETVSVVDSNGQLLARGGENADNMMPMKAEEMRRNYESRMTQSIEDILGRIVGYGRVRANVTAELNFDRITTNEELFDPESAVVRSSQVVEENNLERTPPSGDVSVQNNLPGIASDLLVDPKPSLEGNKIEEVTNFEISKTIRNTVRETGEVKRLSVAVLVDGTYTTDAEGNKTYQPRAQEELDRIAALVRSAIGYDESRGDTLEVVNLQFADIETDDGSTEANLLFGFERSDLLQAVEIITVAVMIILVILLVIQPMVGRLLATEGPKLDEGTEADLLAARPMNPQLTGPDGESFSPEQLEEEDDTLIDMRSVEGKVKASSVKKVEDIVDSYPSETVSVIRSWMTQES
ncbi:MAG: flagellar M-ring protein FliF [Micavibrio aeruginosavorus]|uniref:Flagellar M-ring protein n=1 Tax=Micavibrio aeruginosavorus TaxID=349221 RepID=A0A7T5UHE1_9BACT|nr:MAG: flagellar M-ring protein FliF [Micavibrio aeruginosavorus]